MVRFGKRAQAALEFLMTYSWAILVVIIIIGALAYFGVLNPQSLVPEKCTMTAGMACNDYGLSYSSSGGTNTGTFQLDLVNSLGHSINITGVNITGTDIQGGSGANGCNFPGASGSSITISGGNTYTGSATVANGDSFTVSVSNGDCYPLSPTQKTRVEVLISYYNTGSSIAHTVSGEVFVKPTQG